MPTPSAPISTDELLERFGSLEAAIAYLMSKEGAAEAHTRAFPDGCGLAGHRCEECTRRLGEKPHTMRSWKVGARPGYRGTWQHACTTKGCPRADA